MGGWVQTDSLVLAIAVPDEDRPDAVKAGSGSRTYLGRQRLDQAGSEKETCVMRVLSYIDLLDVTVKLYGIRHDITQWQMVIS